MLNRILGIETVFLMGILIRHGSPLSANIMQLGGVIRDIMNQPNGTQVCDENDNTGNWFIYCSGNILAAVNAHMLESDSKAFVDRPLKDDPQVIRDEFEKKFGQQMVENIDSQELLVFRNRYFSEEGQELEPCTPVDWIPEPPKIARIVDRDLKNFALFLNRQWKLLCRRVKPIKNPERHSLISVPKEFIVPGGRFREFYYWDAYWIVKGLIVSGLTKMVKNMVTNFIHCVKKFGFVPNGGRVYYLRRSQPPFLIPMAYEYFEATKDTKFIKAIFDYLCKEFEFWQNNRSLELTAQDGKNYTVYQYRTRSNVPRPESYRDDIEAAVGIKSDKRQKFFQNIASAAESGWDFSSRWFADRLTMQTIETTNVVPVDLNALLCWNANILKYFADILVRPGHIATWDGNGWVVSRDNGNLVGNLGNMTTSRPLLRRSPSGPITDSLGSRWIIACGLTADVSGFFGGLYRAMSGAYGRCPCGISGLCSEKNDTKKFEQKQRNIWIALKALFYNDSEKAWFDYNLRTKSHNTLFYPSIAMPLFASCYPALDNQKSAKIVEFMNRSGVFEYKSGIPSSLAKNVGEQYDFPNGYSPLQHIVIEGMRKSDNPDVQEMAYKLARKWVLANYRLYKESRKMWDRLDVVGNMPRPGAGGEYDVQDGFGWTNGVILDFLATYYDRMDTSRQERAKEEPCKNRSHLTGSFGRNFIVLTIFAVIVSYLYSRYI